MKPTKPPLVFSNAFFSMKVLKFGGASIKDAAAFQNVARIIQRFADERPIIIASASGKTTNALEAVVSAYMLENGKAFEKLQVVKKHHFDILQALFPDSKSTIYNEINDLFVDLEWIIEEEIHDPYDYVYDQVVSAGELLSTKILQAYLQSQEIPAQWLDVRDCILTDNTYRSAQVDWEETAARSQQVIPPLREQGPIITQGFIGGTSENFTTTLGREGSDYTAAILAYCMDAQEVSIWKDVPGVLTADPRLFEKAEKLDRISYREAIEMTYYGAKVIHPKTIRPLQNKEIPLLVKSFVDPDGAGTYIGADVLREDYPPVVVIKHQQALLRIASRDFHFIDESRLGHIFEAFARHRLKINMMQNSAISFSVCVNYLPERVLAVRKELEEAYEISLEKGMELMTVRHYNDKMLDFLRYGRKVVLEEKLKETAQFMIQVGYDFKLDW